VEKERLDLVLKNTLAILSRFTAVPNSLGRSGNLRDNTDFHSLLGSLRKENPDAFGALYDSAQSSVVLDNIFTSGEVPKTVAELLGVEIEELSNSGHIQRMDAPKDTRNLYGWHQEISYYPQNRDGTNGLVVWIPMLDVPSDGGALVIAKESHKEGFVRVASKKDSKLSSTQNLIDETILEKYEQIKTPAKAGDAVVMYMTTIHKSSNNETDRFRFVAIGRYHIATSDDFTPYRYNYFNNRWIENNLKKEGWDVSDL
jgi:hypothetical protein|tara:strand:+ start:12043 stop:12813 length:771 start_codon:yes stop_codon:yes gene_type:complete